MLGVAKLFETDAQTALYDISYANAILYSRAMPTPGYDREDENAPRYSEALDACNPGNLDKFLTAEQETIRR